MIIVGSRGSTLAMRQTEIVVEKLRCVNPALSFTIKQIKTKGDRYPEKPLGRFGSKGIFVAEIEAVLLAGEIDMAVHSMKDLPVKVCGGLRIAAVPERDDPRDALILRSASSLKDLPAGAVLGTGSLRRIVQLRAYRPDLQFRPLRGNIDTRWRKMNTEGFDGIVLGVAGLVRLGWHDRISERIPPEICLPAVGQGAIAVQTRAADEEMGRLVQSVNHPASFKAVMAERSFLEALGGGCRAPVAALARVTGNIIELEGMVADPETGRIVRERETGSEDAPEELGKRLAARLRQTVSVHK